MGNVCPLYAALPPGQQAKIFQPAPKGTRKCILATNIAETSITIPGVKYVIDTGKCKEKRHIARTVGSGELHDDVHIRIYSEEIAGFDTLLTRDITKSSAMQRTGRAGREVFTSIEVPRNAADYVRRVQDSVSVYTRRRPSIPCLCPRSRKYGVVLLRPVFYSLNVLDKTWKP